MTDKIQSILQLNNQFLDKLNTISLIREDLNQDEIESISDVLNKFQYKDETFLKQNMILVDLNCWLGDSALLLNELCGECDGRIYAIDTFEREHSKYVNIKNICIDNIKNVGASETIQIIQNSLTKASQAFKDDSIDVLFININDYEELKQNLKVWQSKVKCDGIILGRYCETLDIKGIENIDPYIESPFKLHLGVIKAIKEKFEHLFYIQKGNIWYTYNA